MGLVCRPFPAAMYGRVTNVLRQSSRTAPRLSAALATKTTLGSASQVLSKIVEETAEKQAEVEVSTASTSPLPFRSSSPASTDFVVVYSASKTFAFGARESQISKLMHAQY